MISIYQKPIVKNARVQTLILDNDSEVNNLPISTDTKGQDQIGLLCQGSVAFVINSGKAYMLNSSDQWVTI